MKTVHLIFFDAGGGHRSAANALKQVAAEQQRPWNIELLNLQELLDPLDFFRKFTGVRLQDIYNNSLKRGWTRGSRQIILTMHGIFRLYHRQQVKLLEEFWRAHPTDLVVSVIPHFNRALFQGLQRAEPGVPLVTILTDLADFPPHFWIERQPQYFVCGTDKAVNQARRMGHPDERIFRASGMILNPKFYSYQKVDRRAERARLGLDPDLPTALVLFGGHGSADMLDIALRLEESRERVQLIMLCGHNRKLAERLRLVSARVPMHIEGFTREVPYFMQLADFFVGKPGPGSVSEAVAMGLPIVVERNSATMPQERYNATWIDQNHIGIVLSNFREIASAVREMLDPTNFARFRSQVSSHQNRAVFEIPDFLERVLEGAGEVKYARPARLSSLF
jgi:1,2-diacylglycerol 3-beta-galactosyltransferase